jgi:hypothetical protein
MTLPDILLHDWGSDASPKYLLWKPPEIPDSVGPEAVGNLLCAFRAFVRSKRVEGSNTFGSLGDISDAGVRTLLLLAYRASFLTDEGRPVRARVAVRRERRTAKLGDKSDASTNLGLALSVIASFGHVLAGVFEAREEAKLYQCRLDPPAPLNEPKLIAKFAPLLLDPGSALTVAEQGDQLVATGIAALDREDDDWEILQMPRNPQPSAGLLVEILGPGHLRIREDSAEFVLFADRLVNHTSALWEKPVRSTTARVS